MNRKNVNWCEPWFPPTESLSPSLSLPSSLPPSLALVLYLSLAQLTHSMQAAAAYGGQVARKAVDGLQALVDVQRGSLPVDTAPAVLASSASGLLVPEVEGAPLIFYGLQSCSLHFSASFFATGSF
jgi:hypothetical protein